MITMDTHLDSALHELGMLSTVTNSRREFLKERSRTRTKSEPSMHNFAEFSVQSFNEQPPSASKPFFEPMSPNKGYHIVHLDPKYVTGFSSSPDLMKSAQAPLNVNMSTLSLQENSQASPSNGLVPSTFQSTFKDCEMDFTKSSIPSPSLPVLDPKARDCFCHTYCPSRLQHNVPRRSLLRKNRYGHKKKPYEPPARLSYSVPEVEMRQTHKLESKSNSSSPVKGFIREGPLTRSRSLSNLEAARTKLVDIFEEPHFQETSIDIDHVSSRIENLHFVDKTETL